MKVVITGTFPDARAIMRVQLQAKGHEVVTHPIDASAILVGDCPGSKLLVGRRLRLLEYASVAEIPPAARKLNLGARYEIRMIREGTCVVTTGPRGSLLKALRAMRRIVRGGK